MARLMKLLIGLMMVATATGGQMVHAVCFDDNVRLELAKITADTQIALNQSLAGQINDAQLDQSLRREMNLVSTLAEMCGGNNTIEGQQILDKGDAAIKAMLVDYQTKQSQPSQSAEYGDAKIWKTGVERTGGGD